jgi:hypothetical protein
LYFSKISRLENILSNTHRQNFSLEKGIGVRGGNKNKNENRNRNGK